jgi:hypothetical protein
MFLASKVFRTTVSGLVLAAVMGLSPAAHAGTVYLAVNGNDRNDGSSQEKAVATLNTAVSLAMARAAGTNEAMTIMVGTGIFRNQTLMLSEETLRSKLTITGASDNAAEYPAFYGAGWQTWLTYRGTSGRATGLTIKNLRFVDFSTVVSLNGDRDDPSRSNKGTVIANNVFARIGSRPGRPLSTAAVRLVNSRENVIENNYFHTIRNNPVKMCGALHPIYVAHHSSGNRITGNRFDDYCGAAIKLRDRSNDNAITDNVFKTDDSVFAIQEWYCDKSTERACTKAQGECPSTGNIASGNSYGDSIFRRRRIAIDGHSRPLAWCSTSDFSKSRVAD